MKSILGYIYYHLVSFAKLLRGTTPEYSAKLYISCIIMGVIMPPSSILIFLLFGKGLNIFYYIIALIEAWAIHKFNTKFVVRRIDLDLLIKKYHTETLLDKIIGHFVVVLLLAGSWILGFFLLTRY